MDVIKPKVIKFFIVTEILRVLEEVHQWSCCLDEAYGTRSLDSLVVVRISSKNQASTNNHASWNTLSNRDETQRDSTTTTKQLRLMMDKNRIKHWACSEQRQWCDASSVVQFDKFYPVTTEQNPAQPKGTETPRQSWNQTQRYQAGFYWWGHVVTSFPRITQCD